MLVVSASPYRRQRRSLPRVTVPVPPVLVSAVYVVGTSLTLTFARAIDVAGVNPPAFEVDDGVHTALQYYGLSAEAASATSVRIGLDGDGSIYADDVELNVTADNGIRAVDGRVPWAGVSGLVLPFGS